jgi:hypothetical protein
VRDAYDAIKCDAVLCELTVIEDDAKLDFRASSLFRLVCRKIYDMHWTCRDEFDYKRWRGLRLTIETRFKVWYSKKRKKILLAGESNPALPRSGDGGFRL